MNLFVFLHYYNQLFYTGFILYLEKYFCKLFNFYLITNNAVNTNKPALINELVLILL